MDEKHSGVEDCEAPTSSENISPSIEDRII